LSFSDSGWIYGVAQLSEVVLCVQVDVLVTTAGGIEEDLIKCLAPTYMGDFAMQGAHLRSKGLNRIGNLLVPNDNYCKFEDWVVPILDQLLVEQKEKVCYRINL
jgi:deoxyhypusine synthase